MVYHVPGPCCTSLTVSKAYDVPGLLCPKHMVYHYQAYSVPSIWCTRPTESQAYGVPDYHIPGPWCARFTVTVSQAYIIYGVPGLVCPKYTLYIPVPLYVAVPLSVCPGPIVSHSWAHYQYAPAQLWPTPRPIISVPQPH